MAPKKRQTSNPNDTIRRTSPRTESALKKKQNKRGHSEDGSSKKSARKPASISSISYRTSESNDNVARKGKDLSQQFTTSQNNYDEDDVFGAKLQTNNNDSSDNEDVDDDDDEQSDNDNDPDEDKFARIKDESNYSSDANNLSRRIEETRIWKVIQYNYRDHASTINGLEKKMGDLEEKVKVGHHGKDKTRESNLNDLQPTAHAEFGHFCRDKMFLSIKFLDKNMLKCNGYDIRAKWYKFLDIRGRADQESIQKVLESKARRFISTHRGVVTRRIKIISRSK
jgi:hypothetical protein